MPLFPRFPEPHPVALAPQEGAGGGVSLSVHHAGEGPAVVLCHGFPELAYSWRRQFGPLVDAGFRVIAPDQRGYGGSDRPEGSEAYDLEHLTGDLVALLDALEIEKAIFCGHDWGGFVVWAMPLLHPDRTAGVIGVNTPYTPRGPKPPTEMMRLLVGGRDERMYILWFQERGVAEAVLDGQVRLAFEKLMSVPMDPAEAATRMLGEDGQLDMNPFRRLEELPQREGLLTPEELDVFVETFERTGFRGGIEWYRNFDRNWERLPQMGASPIQVPSLMVTAEWDGALRPEMAAGMPALVPDLEMRQIAKCGHWTQQEKPEELNRILTDWLVRRFGQGDGSA
ncbi:MAG: epoxide hydrolase [Deltaproteobacteria bacterium]|jgi:pimeloyl-ACP methyl ester carboxylesterase|nr:epoxide hydrolase [Deltaproteobacteria bacterium]